MKIEKTKLSVCRLGDLAKVGLGFKSLQNQFFYVTGPKVTKFEIEPEYLRPIVQMKQVEDEKFIQKKAATVSVFYCRDAEADLYGTGALAYIRAMEAVPAAEKKQSGKKQTIKAALEAQSGGLWYAPKAQLNKSHLWLRKAVSSRFSPFVFLKSVAFDQRCNFIRPKSAKIDWRLLGALLTSSFFTLSSECGGASSMGAGALELATKKLPEFRVFDVRRLTKGETVEAIELVTAVWDHERPVDWAAEMPGPRLRKLDQWFTARLPKPVNLEELYAAIQVTCKARLALADDKKTTVKQHLTIDIRTVAEGIAEQVRPTIEARPFPEAFAESDDPVEHLEFPPKKKLEISCVPMMGDAMVTVSAEPHKDVLFQKQCARSVAQAIVKSLMLGRRKFSVPDTEAAAGDAISKLSEWLPKVKAQIDEGFQLSAVGTKYEEPVYQEVLRSLAIRDEVFSPEFYGKLTLEVDSGF